MRPETSTLRIMHVITALGIGGAETMLSALVLARAASAPPDRVVSLVSGGANYERLAAAGIPVSGLGMRRGRLDPRAIPRLAKLIEDARPDIVQTWLYHADLLGLLALRFSGRRRLTRLYWGVRCSDMDPRHYGLGLRFTVAAGALLSRLPDGIVANAERGRAWHRQRGYRPRHFAVIDNGVDTDKFRPDASTRSRIRTQLGISADAPVIALPARVDPMKDHATFITALERLPGTLALVIGDGTEYLPERPGLFRLGRRDDVAELLTACDLIVSSSAFGEGFSNAVAEGMACGLIPIATDVGDARRIIGDTGAVVPPRAPDILAAAIASTLEQPELARTQRGRRARTRIVENFSLGRAVAAFGTLYRQGMTDGNPVPYTNRP